MELQSIDTAVFLSKRYKEADRLWILAAEKLWEIKKQLKELEAKESHMSQQLKQLSGNENTKGGGYVYEQTYRKGSIDYTAIPELDGVNLERYRKDIETDIRIYKVLYYPLSGEPVVEEFPVKDKEHILLMVRGSVISIMNNKTEIMNDPCKSGIVRIDIEWRQAVLALGENNDI